MKKSSSYWSGSFLHTGAFIVLDDAIQAAWVEHSPTANQALKLISYGNHVEDMARYACGWKSRINIMEVTNYFLIGFKVCTTDETYAWYCKFCQEPVTWELIGSRRELATIILLKGYSQAALKFNVCTHRLVQLLDLIKEITSCN